MASKINPQADERISAYVRKIRNRGKRQYAERVLRNLRNGWEPPNNASCSLMARQAVEMQIARLIHGG